MSVLFGAHGMAAALSPQAGADLIEPMGRRAAATIGNAAVVADLRIDGLEFAVCRRHHEGEALETPFALSGPLCLALHGRLDDRAGLRRRVGLPTDANHPDAALLLLAYERLGVDCVQHLYGDWAFALWDAQARRLLLARDATGNSALFWWQGGGHIVFATSLPTLMAARPVPSRPNPRWLAGLLTVFNDPALPGATAFESVHALPAGHLLIATAAGPELKRWWWPENTPPLEQAAPDALHEQFRALYDDAVRSCLQRRRGSVALTLSAGLDSGSVAALAAPALAAQGQRLTAFVHTPRFGTSGLSATRTNDEWPLALATARFVGNIDAVACATDRMSPIDGIQRWLDMTAAPSHAAVNWYWLLDIAQQASAGGAAVLLTGQAGNSTVSFEGIGDLRPLLRRAGLAPALRELRDDQTGWLVGLRDRIVKPVLRPGWHTWRRARASMSRGKGWQGFGLLRQSLADSLGLDAAMQAAGHDPSFAAPSAARMRLFRLSLLGGADNGLAEWSELGAAHGLAIRDPTRDRRLVEFCWRLPDEIFWAHGRRRGLIRCALAARLPPEVLDCKRKGLQASDIRLRLLDCRDDFLGRIEEVCRHPVAREWIDTDRLEAAARAATDGEHPLPAGALPISHLLRALAAGLFIVRNA